MIYITTRSHIILQYTLLMVLSLLFFDWRLSGVGNVKSNSQKNLRLSEWEGLVNTNIDGIHYKARTWLTKVLDNSLINEELLLFTFGLILEKNLIRNIEAWSESHFCERSIVQPIKKPGQWPVLFWVLIEEYDVTWLENLRLNVLK